MTPLIQTPGKLIRVVNMADYTAQAASVGRFLAITQLIVGFVLVCFGIADYVIEYLWTGYGCFGIWIGIWVSFV